MDEFSLNQIMLRKLESDLAIERAVLETIKKRLENVEPSDGGFLATTIRNMHWLQQDVSETKIKEMEAQFSILKAKTT